MQAVKSHCQWAVLMLVYTRDLLVLQIIFSCWIHIHKISLYTRYAAICILDVQHLMPYVVYNYIVPDITYAHLWL